VYFVLLEFILQFKSSIELFILYEPECTFNTLPVESSCIPFLKILITEPSIIRTSELKAMQYSDTDSEATE